MGIRWSQDYSQVLLSPMHHRWHLCHHHQYHWQTCIARFGKTQSRICFWKGRDSTISNTILPCPIKKNSQIHQYKVLQRPNNICYVFEKQGHIVRFTNPLASSHADTLTRVTHTVLYIVLFHFTFYQTSINKHFINEDISGKYEINIWTSLQPQSRKYHYCLSNEKVNCAKWNEGTSVGSSYKRVSGFSVPLATSFHRLQTKHLSLLLLLPTISGEISIGFGEQ